jgi:hypothetical protein
LMTNHLTGGPPVAPFPFFRACFRLESGSLDSTCGSVISPPPDKPPNTRYTPPSSNRHKHTSHKHASQINAQVESSLRAYRPDRRGGRLVASIARHALPPRSVAGGLESMPVATCAMIPTRAPTSSTMATRIAATRVPLAARPSRELRPCKLAPASGAKRSTRSPAHFPCASCRQMRTGRRIGANLSCPKGIGVRCTPQLVAPIDARVGGLHTTS